jgi:hypothetical protein
VSKTETNLISSLKQHIKILKPNLISKTIKKKKSIIILTILCDNKSMCVNMCEDFLEDNKETLNIDFYKIFSDETTKNNEVIIHVIL